MNDRHRHVKIRPKTARLTTFYLSRLNFNFYSSFYIRSRLFSTVLHAGLYLILLRFFLFTPLLIIHYKSRCIFLKAAYTIDYFTTFVKPIKEIA